MKHTRPERILGANALAQTTQAMQRHCPNAQRILLVCDENTWSAAGAHVLSLLSEFKECEQHSLGVGAKPTLAAAQTLSEKLTGYDIALAIGSGTVNDVCKYAAHSAKKPYISIATAASMNGYTSTTASLEDGGLKTSYMATPPRAVIADMAILHAAPKRMSRAGIGDTLCRTTVEADMALSHYLFGTPYPKQVFDVMRKHEAAILANLTQAREADENLLTVLIEALLDAGDAMTEHGTSAVASQGEHMIAHTLELMYGSEMYDVLHGELIAITTMTMNRLQHKLMLGTPSVRSLPREKNLFLRTVGKKLCDATFEAYHKKVLSVEQSREINARIETSWKEVRTQFAEAMVAPTTIERIFIQNGMAIGPKDISLDEERYRNACTYAYLTRDRFGFLDLAVMNDKRVA